MELRAPGAVPLRSHQKEGYLLDLCRAPIRLSVRTILGPQPPHLSDHEDDGMEMTVGNERVREE